MWLFAAVVLALGATACGGGDGGAEERDAVAEELGATACTELGES